LARLAGAIDGRWALRGTLPAGGATPSRPPATLHAALEITGGTLAGMPASARLEADVEGVRLDGVQLDRLRVRVSRLEAGLGSTRIQARGELGAPGDRLAFQLRAPALGQLDALTGGAGLAGALSADGEVSGRLSAPGVTVSARGTKLAAGEAGRVSDATLSLAFPPDAASMLDAALALKLEARELLLGATALRSLRVDGEGSSRRHSLRVSLDGGARGGLQAALSGGLSEASRWSGELRELSVSGAVPARLAAPVPIEIEQAAGGLAARVGAAVLEGGFGAIRLTRGSWRDGRAELVADATLSRLGRLAAALGASAGDGNGAASEALDALVLGLRVDLAGSSLSDATGTLVARLDSPPGGVGDGRADLALRAGALSGPLELTLPTLSFANRMIGPEWAVDGRIRFAGRVSGTLVEPRLVGDVEGSGLRLQQRAMGWKLRDGTLAGRFDGERFRLASMKLFSGQKGSEGSMELRGEVRVADLEGRFDLVADRFAVLIGPGQRVVVSGRGEASSTAGAFEIKGNLRADEGHIELAGGDAPTLPEDVVVVSEADRAAGTPAAARRTSLRLASDVTLDLGENLRVRGSGIDARLAGSINLRGTLPDAPRAHGTVRIRDGRYRAYGQELQITRGLIVFNGPLDNPVLDIVALRRGLAVEAGVAVTGTVLSPQVRLTSRPDVPDAEKLSWLVLGVPLDDARSGGQGAALQAAAATLFGRNDGAMAGGVASTLGLDVLTIRSAGTGPGGLLPSSFGGGLGSTLPPIPGQVGSTRTGAYGAGQSGNVLAVGKRLSSRVMVTYEQGLHGVWNLLRIQYDITRRLSLRAQTGSESAIDVLYWHAFD
ncbi:MAG TPA: translocation/assembly module TamB domain-containing protein, partial [Quisquiliibacterium sp.]|nr:translocation/assembly module TamB domain-containing protein [Quisquiliibacterium sp.]